MIGQGAKKKSSRKYWPGRKNEKHVGVFKPQRHPSARLSRKLPHIGTFKPGRQSSALLSRNKSLKGKLVNAEKESIIKTSEREFYFVYERKSLTNTTGTTSGMKEMSWHH